MTATAVGSTSSDTPSWPPSATWVAAAGCESSAASAVPSSCNATQKGGPHRKGQAAEINTADLVGGDAVAGSVVGGVGSWQPKELTPSTSEITLDSFGAGSAVICARGGARGKSNRQRLCPTKMAIGYSVDRDHIDLLQGSLWYLHTSAPRRAT